MYNCFKCDKVLESVTGRFEDLHPDNGLHFYTSGHYGSTHFDPMDGSTLNIFICDDCIKASLHTIERKPNA